MRSRLPQRNNVEPTMAAPRILVADDDTASRRFLAAGLQPVAGAVATCRDGPRALTLARSEHFDLMLVDCRMPGAGALAIAYALRADATAASHTAALVATSAELTAGERQALLTAGCNDILDKPCSLAELRRTIALVPVPGDHLLVLDDTAGLRTSGDYATLSALRQLLREELTTLDLELANISTDVGVLASRLHRLRAACGFCGTTRLARAAQRLKLQLEQDADSGRPLDTRDFQLTLTATMRALDAHLRASPP